MIQLTSQQLAVLDHPDDLKITAVAGSGKTATLLAYADKRGKGKKVLYLAFNRSVKQEAEHKFKAAGLHQVRIETAHSLAYKQLQLRNLEVVNYFRLHELAQALRIRQSGDPGLRYALTSHVLRYVGLYCNQSAAQLRQLNYLHYLDDAESQRFADRHLEEIVRLSSRMLEKMADGSLPVTHDYYLKQFQLKGARLPFDILLFDEAQDASAVMLDVFRKQAGIKILVGDPHQQIYRWRYAVNAMESLPYPGLSLSTSFRFPQEIADLAVQVLNWKKTLFDNYQTTEIKGVSLLKPETAKKAWIARTNMSLIAGALAFIESNPQARLYFEGGFKAYTFASTGYSLQEVIWLREGKNWKIRDPLLAALGSFEKLLQYVEQTGDIELAMLTQLVIIYGDGLPEQLQRLKNAVLQGGETEQADQIFSTVHRSKGMEYDAVRLMPDFLTEKKLRKQIEENKRQLDTGRLQEEINLLYVAITRSRGKLEIPENWFEKITGKGISTYQTDFAPNSGAADSKVISA